MSESRSTANATGYGPIKTLAVRINESTRAQLDLTWATIPGFDVDHGIG